MGLTDAAPVCQVLHDHFAWATMTTVSQFRDAADDVPGGSALPQRSWDGLQQ